MTGDRRVIQHSNGSPDFLKHPSPLPRSKLRKNPDGTNLQISPWSREDLNCSLMSAINQRMSRLRLISRKIPPNLQHYQNSYRTSDQIPTCPCLASNLSQETKRNRSDMTNTWFVLRIIEEMHCLCFSRNQ